MIGMCGEFPADQLNRLIPSASYAEKLITDLKAEHLIRTHYRDALRGYRLTKAAKEMLLSACLSLTAGLIGCIAEGILIPAGVSV